MMIWLGAERYVLHSKHRLLNLKEGSFLSFKLLYIPYLLLLQHFPYAIRAVDLVLYSDQIQTIC